MPRTSSHPAKRSPATRRADRRPLIGANLDRCIFCHGSSIVRAGKRYKHHEIVQRWYCHTCTVGFTPRTASKGSTYPLTVILEALCQFYQGHTAAHTVHSISQRFGLSLHPRTLARWLAEHRDLTTYARLRAQVGKHFAPPKLIRSTRLHHKQVYMYRIHRGKLAHLLNAREHQPFTPIATYLTEMAEHCPHHLFQTDARASQGKATFNLDAVEITAKRNHACRIAMLALQTAPSNTLRHETLQRFMLATDSVTVAVEVPIFLTPEDLTHMQATLGFDIPLATDATLTGHIDVLQIRNGAVHILDYKPNAAKEKPITQLMVYALALSRRTGLRLYDFVCAWFDEHHYYQFYPLHVVHKRRHTISRGSTAVSDDGCSAPLVNSHLNRIVHQGYSRQHPVPQQTQQKTRLQKRTGG